MGTIEDGDDSKSVKSSVFGMLAGETMVACNWSKCLLQT